MNGFISENGKNITVGLNPDRSLLLISDGILNDQEAMHVTWSLLDAIEKRGVKLPKLAIEKIRTALRKEVDKKPEEIVKLKNEINPKQQTIF